MNSLSISGWVGFAASIIVFLRNCFTSAVTPEVVIYEVGSLITGTLILAVAIELGCEFRKVSRSSATDQRIT